MVTIRNKTPEEIEMIDHYLTDVKLNNGYDGVIEHRIAADNGKKSISSAKYVVQSMEEKKIQQIHVRSGGKTKLVLHHDNLNDKSKEVVFKMEGSSITVSYPPKTATTFAERIRSMFPLCGCGFSGESPDTPQVTGVSNSAARIVVPKRGASDLAAGIVGAEG